MSKCQRIRRGKRVSRRQRREYLRRQTAPSWSVTGTFTDFDLELWRALGIMPKNWGKYYG